MNGTTDAAPAAATPSDTPSRRGDWIAGGVLVLIATLTFLDVFTGARGLYWRDLTVFHYPLKHIIHDVVRGGELPYWNRLLAGGQPLAANPQHEIFYPPTWLLFLPSFDLGYRLHILVHIWIALLSMYALLRSMEIRREAAIFGALSWGLGGMFMSYMNVLPFLFSSAWLPLTCLYARRFLLRRSPRDFALCSIAFGLQFLVGEPTTVMQTGILIGLYALYRARDSRPRTRRAATNILSIGAITTAAFLVSAVQILPAIDHLRDSARSEGLGFEGVRLWSMPFQRVIEVVFPYALGHAARSGDFFWASSLYAPRHSPFVYSIYCGLLVAVLAIGGAFVRPRGGRLVLLVVALSTVLAVGEHTPLLRWLYAAGIARSIRYPEKFVMMGLFATIVFAAQMLDRLLGGDDAIRRSALRVARGVLIVAVLMAAIALTPGYPAMMSLVWGAPGAMPPPIVSLVRLDWVLSALRAAAVVLLLATARTARRGAWLAAAGLFVIADILPVAEGLNPRIARSFFEAPPLVRTLPPDHGSYRVFHLAAWYSAPIAGTNFTPQQRESAGRFAAGGGPTGYWVLRNGLFPMVPFASGIGLVLLGDIDETNLLPTVELTRAMWDLKRSGRPDWYVPLMAMSNAWFRTEYRDFAREVNRIHGDGRFVVPVDMIPGPRIPRYYFADRIATISKRDDFVRKLASGVYPLTTAFIREPSFAPARGVVRSAMETTNTARLEVECAGRAFLVMSVTPHKYWRVLIDGRPARSVVTNIAYQGIEVPAGRHSIVMRYANPLVPAGGAISAIALLVLSAVALRRSA